MKNPNTSRVPLSFLLFTLVALSGCSGQQSRPVNKRISATVSGLRSKGLVIQTNGANAVSISSNGPVVLAYIAGGMPYDVTVKEQPHDPTQSCAVTGGSGTVGDSDISNISVSCTGGAYDVIARVSGLGGTGLVLREDTTGSTVPVTADGTITLASQITDDGYYSVEVVTFPTSPSQTCTVSPKGGRLAGANAVVDVTCAIYAFDINTSISGLLGHGLALQADVGGGGSVSVSADGTVTLAAQVADGSPYSVRVATQPTNPSQTCTFASVNGKLIGANVMLAVTCTTNAFDVTASVLGLKGQGLVLHEKVSDRYVTVTADGTVTLAHQIIDSSSYSVEVQTPPINPSQTCTLSPVSGKLTGANVTVAVTCVTNSYSISGIVIGYTGSGLGLYETKLGALPIPSRARSFAFPGSLQSGSSYAVKVWQSTSENFTCSVLNGDSIVGNSDVHVAVLCRPAVSLSAGMQQTLAVDAQGNLWAWGSNWKGQLGNGSTEDQHKPTNVGGSYSWALVSSSFYHSAAIQTDGSLWTWGDNSCGQLGDGTRADQLIPKQVANDKNWALVSAGYCHNVALKTDGTLWAWGENGTGQLGDGTRAPQLSPKQIGNGKDWAFVSAGEWWTVAIKTDGTLWAWGEGDGALPLPDPTSPEKIGTATDWNIVSANGFTHTASLERNGTLWAWGKNQYGELGDGTTSSERDSPEHIEDATDWVLVSAGGFHTAAVKVNGTLWAWGKNDHGQLGSYGTTDQHSPEQIGYATDWVLVAAGGSHTVALKTDGSLWGWGRNDNGQLGNASTSAVTSPVRIW
jgi:alpha-tubulin suppressor-like RCC1 family protein